jgi:hypothetical protein
MRWPYIISSVALIGAGLLLFFNILCGASTSTPLNQWYWLEAQTESIPGAQANTRWTNYNSCGVSNGKNVDCSSSSAAYPMSPVSNFGTTEGVPAGLQSKHGVTYYLSKVGWAFLLIGLLFTLLALIPNFVSLCFPSRVALTTASGIVPALALLFTALSASLITAGYVKARNAFRDAGSHTSLGRTMIAFIWTSVFLLALSTLFSGVGCFSNFKRKKRDKRYSENNEASSHDTYGNDYAGEKEKKKRGWFFSKRQKPEGIEDAGYAAGLDASRDAGVTAVPNTTAVTTGGPSGTQAKDAGANDGAETKNAVYTADIGVSGATSGFTKGGVVATAGITGAVGTGAVLASSVSKNSASDTGYNASDDKTNANCTEYGSSVDKSKFYDDGEILSTGADGFKNRDLTSSESKPYDIEAATDYVSQKKTSKFIDKVITKGADALDSAASEQKAISASAAAFLGIGGAAAAVSATQGSRTTDSDIYRAVHSEFDPRNTDVGAGATHAGANADKDLKRHRNEFENKSTTLPVKSNKYTVSDQYGEYGNVKVGYQRGVAENAVEASASPGKPYRPVKEGAAVSAEDTYNGTHIGPKNKKDLTDTSGYEPTDYYNRNIGATSSNPSDSAWFKREDTKAGSSKNLESLEDAAYRASDATSSYRKPTSDDKSKEDLAPSTFDSAVLSSSGNENTHRTDHAPGIFDSTDERNPRYEALKKSKSNSHEKTGKSSGGYYRSYRSGAYDDSFTKFGAESKRRISPVADTNEDKDRIDTGLASNRNIASGRVESIGNLDSKSGEKIKRSVSKNSLEASYGDNTDYGSESRFENSGAVEDDDLPGTLGSGQYGGTESSYTTTRSGADTYADEDSIPRAFREQYKNVQQRGTASKDSTDIIHEMIEAAKGVI